ncbi:MAG: hypothetical protein R2843_10635 [Thermomicrobiales bacterium]
MTGRITISDHPRGITKLPMGNELAESDGPERPRCVHPHPQTEQK